MPTYYIPNMNPEVVMAPTPLEAAVASGIWDSGGWAAQYEALSEHAFAWVFAHVTIPVMEIDAHGEQVGSTHHVDLFDLIDALEIDHEPPTRRLEEY